MSYTHYHTTSPTSRTGRKTLKYKRSEPVWSIDLEEALLQGLAEYRPSSARDPSLLRRFPRRNKWISNYIFQRTGKARTAKQVGSRLQQLRETCADTEILGLIVNKHFPAVHGSQHSPSVSGESSMLSSSSPSPTSPSFPIIPSPPPMRHHFAEIAVTLVVHGSDLYCGTQIPTVTLDLDENGFSESSYPNARSFTHRAELLSADYLSQSPPEIKFSAQSLQDLSRRYRSVCSVYCDNELVYTDEESNTHLHLAFFDELSRYVLYGLKLVPEFWANILSNPKGTSRYKIVQSIISVDMDETPYADEKILFVIRYSLETGSILPEFKEQNLPASMAIGGPFLQNHHYLELPADNNHDLPADSSFGLAYPQYPTFPLSTDALPLNFQYLHL
ncbi:hypothetical protein HYPSUDRAFT_37135 [Hypholoma sublateritium FD-334 SS-4]|uniref:TEA domain-containing protein n=1 Tax=Hypholoma sublateritium (strain FD-334 SS-4) TaxID=945553 RepID=A0A0D2Q2D4_HYPSF|nr:hypothetical protein HYPSUDRAFT_37135 [Hypholoma sublateritium FD-334 SS-4]